MTAAQTTKNQQPTLLTELSIQIGAVVLISLELTGAILLANQFIQPSSFF